MANEVEVYEQQIKPLTGQEMKTQVAVIHEVMKAVMTGPTKKNPGGVHYGLVPGTDKPTLLKAGAEKLLMTFHLAPSLIIEDLSTNDENRFRVRVTITGPTGRILGAGIGEASSNEEKYKWRKPVNGEEFQETPDDRKRMKWFRGKEGRPDYQGMQIRTNIADVANTILKMAKKRALVDAVLTVTAASDIFTQDVEDLPEELIGGKSTPVSKTPEPTDAPIIVKSVVAKEGKKTVDGKVKTWTLYTITDEHGVAYTTFDAKIAEYAQKAESTGLPVVIVSEKDKFGYKIVEIKAAPPAQSTEKKPETQSDREPGLEG